MEESNQTTPDQGAAEPTMAKRKLSRGFWIAISVLAGLIALIFVADAVVCGPGARPTAQRNACIANLRQLDGAIQQWALENHKPGTDKVALTNILNYLKASTLPLCPAAGTYHMTTVSAAPTCTQSAHGHSL
jgi:hypothetical protein